MNSARSIKRRSPSRPATDAAARMRKSRLLCVEPLEPRTHVSASILGVVGAAALGSLLAAEESDARSASGTAKDATRRPAASSGLYRSLDGDYWESRSMEWMLSTAVPSQDSADTAAHSSAAETIAALLPGSSSFEVSARLPGGMPRISSGLTGGLSENDAEFLMRPPAMSGLDSVFTANATSALGNAPVEASSSSSHSASVAGQSAPTARSAKGLSVTLSDDVPEADAPLSNKQALPEAGPLAAGAGLGEFLQYLTTSCGCGCGCGGNTPPFVGQGCVAPSEPLPPSEIYLSAGIGASTTVDLATYIHDTQQSSVSLAYSVQVAATNADASIVTQYGRPTLLVEATGVVDVATLTVRATDNEGAYCDWEIDLYTCKVVGYEVEERAWGGDWSAPEDGGLDWRLLWQSDYHRWKPMVEPSAAQGKVVSVEWYVAGQQQPFAASWWSGSACSGDPYDYDQWAYGSPDGLGERAIVPRVWFGPTQPTYLGSYGDAWLSGTAPSADQPRIGMADITNVTWVTVDHSKPAVVPPLGTRNLAQVRNDQAIDDPYWRVYPDFNTPQYKEVHAQVTVSGIPSGMTGTVYVDWYDPDNELANIPPTPPINRGVGMRDNAYGLSLQGPDPLEFTSATAARWAVFQMAGGRLGDNFLVAAHPKLGVASTFEFGEACGCGCGCGDLVLLYDDFLDPADPLSATKHENLSGAYQSSKLNTTPSVDIDTDSDNNRTIEHSYAEEQDENHPQRLGKRIFINHDDDDANGIADLNEIGVLGYDDNDLAPVSLRLPWLFAELVGYRLEVECSENLKLWGGRAKQETLLQFDELYSNRKYTHTLSGYPETFGPEFQVYVEGVATGSGLVNWRLFDVTDTLVASDSVKFNVEDIVWPDAGAVFDHSLPTSQWQGFRLSRGWSIDKALEDLVNGDNAAIRTHYPEYTTFGGYTGMLGKVHTNDDAISLASYPNGFDMTVVFEFDGPAFVDAAHTTSPGVSFFRNSGVYIYDKYEIQIFDTNSIMAAIGDPAQDDHELAAIVRGNSVAVGGWIDAATPVANVCLHHHTDPGQTPVNWTSEPVNGCVTGIPYKKDLRFTDYADLQTAASWLNVASNVMTVEFDPLRNPSQGVYLRVTLNEHETFDGYLAERTGNGSTNVGDDEMIHLQSHWGSGVRFTSHDVTPKHTD